ncbi:MAG: methyltransferase family protein [Candidatus Acidiferrales bacterium]
MQAAGNRISAVVVFLAALYALFVLFPRHWSAVRIAGTAIALPALALWLVARIQLGTSFSIQAEARSLVTTGLYSKFTSPIYLFGSILIAGLILAFGRPIFFLVFVIILPMQFLRMRQEARVLEAKFGEGYRAYRERAWF